MRQMAFEPIQTTWGDLVTVKQGKYVAKSDLASSRSEDTPVPTVGANGVLGYVPKASYQRRVPLVTCRGSNCGLIQYPLEPVWVNNNAMALDAGTDEENSFIYYLALNTDFNDVVSGSAQPQITAGPLKSKAVSVPPREYWPTIAATLGALDDKIESNRRAIGALEALGEAILERALKLDAYGFPAYSPDLRVGDMVSVLETGSRPKGGVSAATVGIVSLGAESIQSAGVMSTTAFKRVPRDFADSMRRGKLVDGDVLVYKDGGSPGNFVPHVSAFGYGFPVVEATINEHVYRVRAIEGVSQGLLYWLLRSSWMDGEMRKRGTGVAIPGLNSSNFKDLPWPVLSKALVQNLNASLSPLLVRMLKYGTESRRLAALRDALLPELLSGRIRAADVETAP